MSVAGINGCSYDIFINRSVESLIEIFEYLELERKRMCSNWGFSLLSMAKLYAKVYYEKLKKMLLLHLSEASSSHERLYKSKIERCCVNVRLMMWIHGR